MCIMMYGVWCDAWVCEELGFSGEGNDKRCEGGGFDRGGLKMVGGRKEYVTHAHNSFRCTIALCITPYGFIIRFLFLFSNRVLITTRFNPFVLFLDILEIYIYKPPYQIAPTVTLVYTSSPKNLSRPPPPPKKTKTRFSNHLEHQTKKNMSPFPKPPSTPSRSNNDPAPTTTPPRTPTIKVTPAMELHACAKPLRQR